MSATTHIIAIGLHAAILREVSFVPLFLAFFTPTREKQNGT